MEYNYFKKMGMRCSFLQKKKKSNNDKYLILVITCYKLMIILKQLI